VTKDIKTSEELVGEAMAICFESNLISPYTFQRALGISLVSAMWVFEELEARGIIVQAKIDEEEENIIGKINRQRLKKFFKN
jgi:ribosomal protein S25